MSSKYAKSVVLPAVQLAGLNPDNPGQEMKVFPVAECYDFEDGDDPEPEFPHVWFASQHDAESWAAKETNGEIQL